MDYPPMLYLEVEYTDPKTGEQRVRLSLATLEYEARRTVSYRLGLTSWRCEIDELASLQPRDARLRAPLFAQMDAYLNDSSVL